MTYARIIGTGSCVPEKVLTNADLEKIVDTSDEWIVARSGIKERRILAEHELPSDMMETAARRAVDAAGIDKDEIDLIVVATITFDYLAPSAACIIQQRLGIKSCPAFDVNAGCSGFVFGLNVVNQYIKSGASKCALLVASEALSKVTNWEDRSTCVLFGDGAGSVVLKADSQPGVYATNIYADGNYHEFLTIPNPLYPEIGKPYVHMRGNELFKIAINKLSESSLAILRDNNMDVGDVDWLVPHQANLRIIKAVAKKLNLPMDRVMLTIEKYGNTSASSLPLALDTGIREGKIKHGDTVLMEVFGAGLTWGSVLMKY